MNDKLLKELREWDEKYCDGELCFDSRDKFREILFRHEQEQGGDSMESLTHRKPATVTVKAFCRLYNKGRFIKNSIWADNVNKTGIPCVIIIKEKHLGGWKP